MNAPRHACDAPRPVFRKQTRKPWRAASRWIWNAPTFAGWLPRQWPGAVPTWWLFVRSAQTLAAAAQPSAANTRWRTASAAPKPAHVARMPVWPWLADDRFSLQENLMNLTLPKQLKAICLVPLTALWLASAPAQAQSVPAMGSSANMPMGQMHKGAAGSRDMKASMMMGMDGMQKMMMSGDTDKDFAMMMKMHHQQALNMAEMELAHGKSADMKAMAKQIIVAQKKEIAQFDKWLAQQK
jgi:hypothetical protein